jgi:hypothetical protein
MDGAGKAWMHIARDEPGRGANAPARDGLARGECSRAESSRAESSWGGSSQIESHRGESFRGDSSGRPPAVSWMGKSMRKRDLRLDAWRGLCLVDMLLIHLIYAKMQFGPSLQNIIGEYLRFAAGGFVLAAGMGVGRFFLPKIADPLTRRKGVLALWRRAFVLMAAYYLGTLGYIILDQWLFQMPLGPGIWPVLRDVLLFKSGDDLLPLYMILTACTPVMLAVLCRQRGWIWLALASAATFWYGTLHPDAMSLQSARPVFRPLLWQSIFVIGLILGSKFKQYDAWSLGRKITLAAVMWIGFAILFLADYGSSFGIAIPTFGLTFSKIPLSLGETLRYLTLALGMMVVLDLAWPLIASTLILRLLASFGQRSLVIYVAHTFIVLLCSWVCDNQIWSWGKWEMVLIVPSLALLWVIAWISGNWKSMLVRAVGVASPMRAMPESI